MPAYRQAASILDPKITCLRQSRVLRSSDPFPSSSISTNLTTVGLEASLTQKSESLCNRITGLAQNPRILVICEDAIPPLPGYFFHDANALKVPDSTVYCR